MKFLIGLGDAHLKKIMIFSVVLSVFIAVQHHFWISFPVHDPFHYGEFFAAAMALLHQAPFEGTPFTIHGAADFIPALTVAYFMESQEKLISYTILIYPGLSLVSVFITIFVAMRMALRFGSERLFIIPFLVLFPVAIGWRDLFFVLSLALFAELVFNREGRRSGIVMQILFGLVIALGTYWSFNRGIAALLAFGPVTLWLTLQDRRFLISICTAIIGFLLMSFWLPGVSVYGYVENLWMLFSTSSQWKYPPSLFGYALTTVLLTAIAASTVAAVATVRQRGLARCHVALITALVVASAVYFKIGIGRTDDSHLVMAAWLPLLVTSLSIRWDHGDLPLGRIKRLISVILILFVAMVLFYSSRSKYTSAFILVTLMIILGEFLSRRGRSRVFMAMAILVMAFSAFATVSGVRKVARGDFDWLFSFNMLPANDIAVTEEVLWVALRIEQSGAECIFDLANTGLINAVAGLPSCSRFTYPVYANAHYEHILLEDLSFSNPPVIVYTSDYWSYAIDGRTMSARFPDLDALIRRLYPREECNHGVCLRYKR